MFTHGIFLLGQWLLHEQVKKCYSVFVHTRQLVFDLGRAAAQAIARLFSLGSFFFSFSFARLSAGY